MKFLAVGICFICILSCQENMKSKLETEEVKVSLKGAELYQHSISEAIPTEGGYRIEKQAENHQISEMNGGQYRYKAQEGFRGSDTVEIVLSTGIGDGNLRDQKRWIIEITVE